MNNVLATYKEINNVYDTIADMVQSETQDLMLTDHKKQRLAERYQWEVERRFPEGVHFLGDKICSSKYDKGNTAILNAVKVAFSRVDILHVAQRLI